MDTLFQWSNVTEQYLTGAYIITLRGAQRILDMFSSSQFYAADWMTTRFQLAFRSTVSYFPWIVIQDGEDSMIRSDISADRAKVLRCLRACGYLLTHYCI
jgi:GR25 family glycosyltransferase involved in LPS biosynthesis